MVNNNEQTGQVAWSRSLLG